MARPKKQVAPIEDLIEYKISFTINKVKIKTVRHSISAVNSIVAWAKNKGSTDVKVKQKKLKYDDSSK